MAENIATHSDADNLTKICIICNTDLGTDGVCKVTRGLDALLEASLDVHKDGLHSKFQSAKPLLLHIRCRKKYTDKRLNAKLKNVKPENHPTLRKSGSNDFNFKTNCFLCGKAADGRQGKWWLCAEKNVGKSFLERAKSRNCPWGDTVYTRIVNNVDLIAAEGRYHEKCNASFRLNKQNNDLPKGRPLDQVKLESFYKLCKYLDENNKSIYTLTELKEIIKNDFNNEISYSNQWLKQKLRQRYGSEISISSIVGKSSTVCFLDKASKILDEKANSSNPDVHAEEDKIIKIAAALIRKEIRKTNYNLENYGSPENLKNDIKESIPPLLASFLNVLTNENKSDTPILERRKDSIAHALISMCKPRSFISPLLLSLGVYIHKKYASRELLDILSSLGFSENYSEVQRYENSVLDFESDPLSNVEKFVQFVFDNADFNVNTVDGKNTIHVLGGIAAHTPQLKCSISDKQITRLKEIPKASSLEEIGTIPMKFMSKPDTQVTGLLSESVKDVSAALFISETKFKNAVNHDTLWLVSQILNVSHPSWNSFMQFITSKFNYDVSSIEILPFVNANPTKHDTLYSALCFVTEYCIRNNIPYVSVTFDQPSYQKASDIVRSFENLRIFLRLGGFHLLMSLMGALGNIMEGSGIEELWCSIYASGVIPHMMKGHAYSRALRAHFLTHAALNIILLKKIEFFLPTEKLAEIFSGCIDDQRCLISSEEDELEIVFQKLRNIWERSAETDRTIKLWYTYCKGVELIKLYLRAEKSGDWDLHLYCIRQFLPFFHSGGHIAYAKSAHLYLQDMLDLKNKLSPEDFVNFTSMGYFTIRRSHKFWSGIFADQTIEQWLMKQLKGPGGLTRGRGFTDSNVARFISAFPKCVPICHALEKFCGTFIDPTSPKIVFSKADEKRDCEHLNALVNWLESHSLFESRQNGELINIANGIVAHESVNCDSAIEIGENSLSKMIGKNFGELSLPRTDKVKSISSVSNTVIIHGEEIVVNSELLFNRITCVINNRDDLLDYFSYELAPAPTSLFDKGFMRKTQKSSLREALTKMVPNHTIPENSKYVIDGGWFLHHEVWPQSAKTYGDVCDHYVEKLLKNYGKSSSLVFDGYDDIYSTKKCEQIRRKVNQKDKISPNILNLSPDLPLSTNQTSFLSNDFNKQQLIAMLMTEFRNVGIYVSKSEGDADRLIVQTAFEVASQISTPVVVVGNDTDILILLIGLIDNLYNIYMNYDHRRKELGSLKNYILFIHAISGCDTTSALFSIGKKSVLKLCQQFDYLKMHMGIFYKNNSSQLEVAQAGEVFLLALYKGENELSLNSLRCNSYKTKIGKLNISQKFRLESLPPTTEAAKQHSYRVYLTIQNWLGNILEPFKWGWVFNNYYYSPVKTEQSIAPESLLNLVSCGCKKGCNASCSCRKMNMICTEMCVNCSKSGCTNSKVSNDHMFSNVALQVNKKQNSGKAITRKNKKRNRNSEISQSTENIVVDDFIMDTNETENNSDLLSIGSLISESICLET